MGQRRRENRIFNSSLIYQFVTHFWSSLNRASTVSHSRSPGQFVTHISIRHSFLEFPKRGHYMVEFLSLFFFSSWIERNILCAYYIAAFYHTMSSKSTQKTKKANKKTPSGTQTRKSRPLSPGAATFEALNNPAYDTSERHFSPPTTIPPSPPRLQNLGITGPSPPRRIRSLDDIPRSQSMDELDPVDRSLTRSPNIFKAPFPMKDEDEDEDEEELDFSFASVPAPDEPLKKGGGYMHPALKNYMKRSKRKSKKNSKKKSKRKSKKSSKKNSKKNSKKKSKKASRRL